MTPADPPPLDATREADHNEGPGGSIGPYRLLQQIGEGGFGAVYEADQERPVKRRVALKLIKLGMDTQEVIARFYAERQALALMDHPNIAHVLDVGMTAGGRPYFVMELVRGVPITTWCDRHKLDIPERLSLFEQVCQAVQHAHTKGVIHRDLKPSNVLVSAQEDKPIAKVIDFGIAKAISGRLTDKTLFTAQQQMIGTPLYMSPEQAEGSVDIDTRSDIYSLGVMLYELLTGTTPFEVCSLRSVADREIRRIICEVEPPAPSFCLSAAGASIEAVASLRHTDSRSLGRWVRGELDWIVMKAIDKERSRRYDSASALGREIQRFLAGQPIQAAPPSLTYRVSKFIRRNRVVVLAGVVAVMSLVAGVVVAAWQAHLAGERAADLELVTRFQAEMLQRVPPASAGKLMATEAQSQHASALAARGTSEAEAAPLREAFAAQWTLINTSDLARRVVDQTILEPAAKAAREQFADRPLIEAQLSEALSLRYRGMGLYQQGLDLQLRALDIRKREQGARHPDAVGAVHEAGLLLRMLGRNEESLAYHLEAVEGFRALRGNLHEETIIALGNLAVAYGNAGRAAEGVPVAEEALALQRGLAGSAPDDDWTERSNLAFLQQSAGKLREAEAGFRELLARQQAVRGADDPETLGTLNNLGGVLFLQDKLAEAEPYWRKTLEARRQLGGFDHPYTLRSAKNLVDLLLAKGELKEADALIVDTVERSLRVLGPRHPDHLVVLLTQARLSDLQGQPEQVLAICEPIEEAARAQFTGSNQPRLVRLLQLMGKAHLLASRLEKAEAMLLEASQLVDQGRPPTGTTLRDLYATLAELYETRERAQPGSGHAERAQSWRSKASAVSARGAGS